MEVRMFSKFFIAGFMVLSLGLTSCQNTGDGSKSSAQKEVVIADVVTAEVQKNLTPAKVYEDLRKGNERFVNNALLKRDFMAQVKKTAQGQFPKAVVISCVDSRVPVEYVLDQGIGDMFVSRVAGNFVDPEILGGLEFATKVSGSKVILVLGHESCGAVKAAIDNVKLGNITPMLEQIQPALELSNDFKGEKSTKNPEFVSYVCENNVKSTLAELRTASPIMKEMEDNGEIMLVGGIYSLTTGKIDFFTE
jgi:carbonic anhydrase